MIGLLALSLKRATGYDRAGALTGTGVAPLLMWLGVVCGLAGVTVVRIDEPQTVIAMWFGAIVGLALGQLVALLRLRLWPIVLASISLIWGLQTVVAGLEALFPSDVETVVMALVPAIICGYASLTERGALLAFWYPAMLWMLVILDAPTADPSTLASLAPGATALRSSIGLVVGLVVLFIAFLRARESRRVALWRTYSGERLARPVGRTVLRASPVRNLSGAAWTAFVGAGALTLAGMIAPELWQKERAQHDLTLAVRQPRIEPGSAAACCHERPPARERVEEYFSLVHGYETKPLNDNTCVYCPSISTWTSTSDSFDAQGWYRGSPGAGLYGVGTDMGTDVPAWWRIHNSNWTVHSDAGGAGDPLDAANGADSSTLSLNGGVAYTDAPSYSTPMYNVAPVVPAMPTPSPAQAAVVHAQPVAHPALHVPAVAPAADPAPSSPIAASAAPVAPAAAAPNAPPASIPTPVASAPSSSPWRWLMSLVGIAMLVPLTARALRRSLTLRHLVRPFWAESIDQRISNQWLRMLIGLHDAGIKAKLNEQPGAFARRVGIAGMDVCATILERVRHGVRVDEEDLERMTEASAAVYRASRQRAGAAGRLAGTFRSPLT